jgi:DNA polymerase
MSANISREDILRELELLPAWRPREPLPKVNPVSQLLAETSEPVPAATPETLAVPNSIQPLEPDELPAEITLPVMEDAEIRINTVFGMGDPNAEWLFVGESSGTEESLHSEPFIGQAGKLLDNMLAAMQLRRGQNVFMAHVLNEAVLQCEPHLKEQVALVKPKLIVALGQFAAQCLLQSNAPMADLRGRVHQYHDVPVIVTFHPADLLQRPEDKPRAWDDLCFAKQTMQLKPLQSLSGHSLI